MEQAGLLALIVGFGVVDCRGVAGMDELSEKAKGDSVVKQRFQHQRSYLLNFTALQKTCSINGQFGLSSF